MSISIEISPSIVVKYTQDFHDGIVSRNIGRNCIGCVLRGSKRIYSGDTYSCVSSGMMFFHPVGCHYVEYIPERNAPFEQIVFYYTSQQLNFIIVGLTDRYSFNISKRHLCGEHSSDAAYTANLNNAMVEFFACVNRYIQDNVFVFDKNMEMLKLVELVYMILSGDDNVLRRKLVESAAFSPGNIEQVVYANVFSNITVNDLAGKCNRSISSFKKEFKRLFGQTPHRWIVARRLERAQMLLLSTDKSVSQISDLCVFPNSSHFIRLFRASYGVTPSAYRLKCGLAERLPSK